MSYQNLIVETRGKVGIIRLNRPQALNALNSVVVTELSGAIDGFETDPLVACMIITGSDKVFAAGADIKEMAGKSYMDAFYGDHAGDWDHAARARKPVIALMDEACKAAEKIAGMSMPAVMMAKECVNRAFETSLTEGIRFERRLFHSLFSTEDQKEGMTAFVEKRTPDFKNR